MTDLGAGPGTALWPAMSRWPDLARATLVDRDAEMLRLGVRIWTHGPRFTPGLPPRVHTVIGDLAEHDAPPADLVVVSYALGEADPDRAGTIVDVAFALARQAVVVVEPGTPAGFARIRAARDRLRTAGAVLVAPCPHADACPMAGADWCHFAARLDRSRLHRLLKQAELGWEDEKFSYVIAAPRASTWPARAAARIVRRPRRETGHVRLALCAPGGLAETVVTRRAADYKTARDVDWGDAWPPRG
jgi:ribosomal protein RSM22 (predicted rRNA methylase)